MTTTVIASTGTDVPRDSKGRHYTAPAWSGDVTGLTSGQLHDRIEAIGSYIGRLFTTVDHIGETWRRDDPSEFVLNQAIGWRLAALNELEKRPNRFGDGS